MTERIEIDPRRCGGSPVVKGTPIPVVVILEQLASGESWDSLLEGYPELTREDIQAVLIYAKASVEHTDAVSAEAGTASDATAPGPDVPRRFGGTASR